MDKIAVACGIWKLIEDGIERYVQEHGRKPVALLLHPSHCRDFYSEAGTDDSVLDGVSIFASPLVPLAILVD
jgi:hypothetical protein